MIPKQNIEDLLAQQVPFQPLVEQSLVGIYLIQNDLMRYCNQAFAAITGHTPAQLINHPIAEFVTSERIQSVREQIEQRVQRGIGSSSRYITQANHIDGHTVDLEVHGRTILFEGQPAIAGVAVDITQQMNYERELKASHEQLVTISRYVNSLRETQRREMAREIHDLLGGLLTSIKMNATRLLSRSDSAETIEIAEDIIQLTQESIDFARETSEQLYPATLKYLGLVPTLENLLKQTQKRSHLRYRLEVQPGLPKLSDDVALMIFRITQEAVTNIVKHAKASCISIRLKHTDQQLNILISDNGIGLDATEPRFGAMGLLFMQERCSEFNGNVTIHSDPNGTEIQLQLPINSLEKQALQP